MIIRQSGGTSTECINIYGTSKPKCNTATNMCKGAYGTCSAPKDLVLLNCK